MQDETSSTSLGEVFPFLVARASSDWPAWNCPADRLLEVLRTLRDEHRYKLLSDVTAIDNGVEAHPRFTCVYHLYSMERHTYVRLAADCASSEAPTMPSVTQLWAGADWHERETYDMFGIRFEGHPDLKRILMWEGYPYYPLRKEFPLAGIETEFPSAEIAEETGVKLIAAPMAGGPFTAASGVPMSKAEPRAKDQSWNERKEKPNNDPAQGSASR